MCSASDVLTCRGRLAHKEKFRFSYKDCSRRCVRRYALVMLYIECVLAVASLGFIGCYTAVEQCIVAIKVGCKNAQVDSFVPFLF